jgi:hypothetical protein
MKRVYVLISLLLLASLFAGCTPAAQGKTLEEYRMPTDVPTAQELTATVQTETAASIPPADCPVTVPGKVNFQAPEPYSPDAPWQGMFWYGGEHLWTALRTDGVWKGLPDNPQGYTQKIMWWSDMFDIESEPQPALEVLGRRLDAEAPPLQFHGATNAMAGDIKTAMLTGVDFPTMGCWEITGHYKKSGLMFVVWLAP